MGKVEWLWKIYKEKGFVKKLFCQNSWMLPQKLKMLFENQILKNKGMFFNFFPSE